MAESGRLGVAIFGLGRAGSIHIRNVVKDYNLTLLYAVDVLVDKTQKLVDSYHEDQCAVLPPSEQNKVFSDERVDFVMVCTPTDTHEPICIAALNAGKHTFCEKPIAATEEATAKVYDAAKTAGVHLFCSFNRRFDPSVRKVFEDRANVGKIQVVKTCARDSPFPPLAYLAISGGVFHDCLVHDIDMICWIIGSYPTSVYAAAHCYDEDIKSMNDVDTVVAIMKFAGGELAMIDTSRDSCYGYDQRLEVYGDKGMLLNNNQRPNNTVQEASSGATQGRIYNSFNDRYADSYILALENFYAAIRGKTEVEVTKENSINVSRIATALEHSSRTGQQVDVSYD